MRYWGKDSKKVWRWVKARERFKDTGSSLKRVFEILGQGYRAAYTYWLEARERFGVTGLRLGRCLDILG